MTAVQEPSAEREIGRERRRKEDQRLITGRTRWTDNIALPGMLHLAMVRSPFAHAKIVSIDTSEAKGATNVVDVLTGADLGEAQGACINAWAITEDQVTPPHLPMPVDRVAFAGEVVAVVHPAFLYELLWNLLVVLLLVLVDRRFRIGHGRLFALYVAGYCAGRFWIELMRSDPATVIAGIRINLFTSAIVFVLAAAYVVLARKGREAPEDLTSPHGRTGPRDEVRRTTDASVP